MVDNTLAKDNHVIIIGGGIFGLSTAIILGEHGFMVTVLEKENDLMTKASLVNQNRIHMGYHYPRSLSTGKESLIGIQNFKKYYPDTINEKFTKYYAIAKHNSKVSADEFYRFCIELELPLEEKYPDGELLDRSEVEACWLTPEPVFDYYRLKNSVTQRIIKNPNINVIRNAEVIKINIDQGTKHISISDGSTLHSNYLINATYSKLPEIANAVSKKQIEAKYELCIMPIMELNDSNQNQFGITIMDGPYCSLMPKGFNKREYIVYHVNDSVLQTQIGTKFDSWKPINNFPELVCLKNSAKFFPIIKNMSYLDTWITTRIILPNKEENDARPTLLIDHNNNIFSIFSGKLTTAIDIGFELLNEISS